MKCPKERLSLFFPKESAEHSPKKFNLNISHGSHPHQLPTILPLVTSNEHPKRKNWFPFVQWERTSGVSLPLKTFPRELVSLNSLESFLIDLESFLITQSIIQSITLCLSPLTGSFPLL